MRLQQAGTSAGIVRALALDPAAMDELSRAGDPFTLDKGELLFPQGGPADAAYLLTEGALEVAARIPGDELTAISMVRPGEVVGEFALLDDRPRSASVRAVEASTGLRIPRIRIAALVADGWPPALALISGVCRLMAARIRQSLERIEGSDHFEDSALRRPGTGALPQDLPAEDLAPLLAGVPRLAEWTHHAQALCALGTWQHVARGGRVHAPGETGQALRVVLRGALRSGVLRPGGLEPIGIHGPGEIAGLVAALDGAGEPLAVEAAEETLMLAIPAAQLASLSEDRSPLARAVMSVVGRQLVLEHIRANRHLGRIAALERFNAAGEASACAAS